MQTLLHFYKGKKVLITGHTGFKGAWLAFLLQYWGADVVGIALAAHTNPNLFTLLHLDTSMKSYVCDISDYAALKKIFEKEKPEIVFHLAALALVRKSYDEPLSTFAANTMGTAHVLQAIKETESIRAGVIITTDKVYENKGEDRPFSETDALSGHDPYSASKAAADIIATSYMRSFFHVPHAEDIIGLASIAVARSGNVVGGGDWGEDRLIPDVVRAVYETHMPVNIRNPHHVRPWQFILDLLAGYLLLGKALYTQGSIASGSWNFGPDEENCVTVNEIVTQAIGVLHQGTYQVISDADKHEAMMLKLDATKAKTNLGWIPRYGIKETIQATLAWYSYCYEKKGDMREFTRMQINNFFIAHASVADISQMS